MKSSDGCDPGPDCLPLPLDRGHGASSLSGCTFHGFAATGVGCRGEEDGTQRNQDIRRSRHADEPVAARDLTEPSQEVYLLKQIEALGNACGTIGLLHAMGNATSGIELVGAARDLHLHLRQAIVPHHTRAKNWEKKHKVEGGEYYRDKRKLRNMIGPLSSRMGFIHLTGTCIIAT